MQAVQGVEQVGARSAGAGCRRWVALPGGAAAEHTPKSPGNARLAGGSGVPGWVGTRRFGAPSATVTQSRGGEHVLRYFLRRVNRESSRRARSVSCGRRAEPAPGQTARPHDTVCRTPDPLRHLPDHTSLHDDAIRRRPLPLLKTQANDQPLSQRPGPRVLEWSWVRIVQTRGVTAELSARLRRRR